MNFSLTNDQRQIYELAGDFARREILPVAADLDRQEQFPKKAFDKAREVGLLGLNVPEKYGGSDLGALALTLVAERFAWACTGITAAITLNALIADAILVGGDSQQKKTYLGRLLSGELGAYAITEPEAGSDVASIRSLAISDGDRTILNGSKTWISNATEATFFIIFATSDPSAGHHGIGAYIVERKTAGLTVGKKLGKLGQRAAPAAELFLSDVAVGKDARLGEAGTEFHRAMKVFDRSRPMVAAYGVGLVQRCLDESLNYARQRHSMGVPIIKHQVIGHKIVEMGIRLEAARLLTRQAAQLLDEGKRNTLQASYAKAYAADSAMWAASEAVQIFGGMGYSDEYPVEKLLCDAKLLQIYEGTSEIQRNIMVRELTRGS